MKKKLIMLASALLLAGQSMFATGDYGLPDNIQDGNILHCFDWPVSEVKAALPQIAAAGFGAVQISPLQRPDVASGYEWHALYRPYDLAFKASSFCSRADLTGLCSEAATYGIKVIVDVVANHVDKTSGYHDTWWDSNNRVRWEGSINYGNRYSITHGQLGDYGDINSESSEVQARAKAYVEDLKSMGVSGIRWDAAKHIGLPSEGCDFWSAVTSVSGMYHYGEILDTPGPDESIIKEYAQYMSVTDNRYSNSAAQSNGGIPYAYAGSWAGSYGLGSKCVYWGESHDTYSNDEWSQDVDQSVIDRAYCSFACRSDATALYFSRPSTKGFSNIKVAKGSTAFTGKHIAEVNKFRNVMVGRADYFSSNGSAISVTRKDGGAVIVMKGNGSVSVENGGGYCPAGTYTDRVSGGTFTVTSSTISGTVGSSGVAVLIKDGLTTDPDSGSDSSDTGGVTITGDYNLCYSGSHTNVHYWGGSGESTWPGVAMTTVTGSDGNSYKVAKVPTGTTGVVFNSNNGGSQTSDLSYTGTQVMNDYGATQTSVTFTTSGGSDDSGDDDNDNDDNVYVYVDGWDNVYCYIYKDAGGEVAAWPGTAMSKDSSTGYWKYQVPDAYRTGSRVIINTNTGSNRYPADMEPGMELNGKSMIFHVSDYSWVEYNGSSSGSDDSGSDDTGTPDPDATNLVTDYYSVNPNGQVGTNKTINMSFSDQKSSTALSNWTANELIAQGVARDVAQAFKGLHERPIVDSYAIYAAYDNDYLYLGVQFVYTVWDLYGEGKQPGESKPYNMDGHMCWAFDLDPNSSFDGYINGTGPIWNENQLGAKFANGVDAVWMGSTKPGVGTPGFFIPTSDGHASYDSAYCKSIPGSYYGYADGLLPSITAVYGQPFGSTPEALAGNSGFVDLRGDIDDSAHTFYEWKFPLSTLGVTADYIRNTGIGVMYVDKYGSSPVGGTPYDPSYFDNVMDSYSMDESTSKEKEDEDIITYAPARVGKLKTSGVGTIAAAGDNGIEVYAAAGKLYVKAAEAGRVTVTNLVGVSRTVEVGRGTNVFTDFAPGFYVVNGKKVVL